MYRTRQYHIRKGHKMYSYCSDICKKSTNLYNRANYILRQYATAVRDFENLKPLTANQMEIYKNVQSVTDNTKHEPKNKWLTYGILDFYLKQTKDISYYNMYSQSNQQILKLLLRNYKAFFNSLKVYKVNKDVFTGRPKMPGYKKEGSYTTAILTNQICKIVDGRYLKVPGYKYKLNLGEINQNTFLKEVRIKHSADVFIVDVVLEIDAPAAVYKVHPELSDEQLAKKFKTCTNSHKYRVIGIDPGLNNFCAVTNNFGDKPFLVNGRTIKSVNNYYNKRFAKLKSQAALCNNREYTKRINRLTYKRNCMIKDKLHKISKYIAEYAKNNNVDVVILGHNIFQKQKINTGAANNQSIVQIPYFVFAGMLQYKLKEYGIRLVLTEESYTSKADFKAEDKLPVFNNASTKSYTFSGKRIKRGLYRYNDGSIGNADINGAANIIRKVFPNIKGWDKGVVDIPYAVTIA